MPDPHPSRLLLARTVEGVQLAEARLIGLRHRVLLHVQAKLLARALDPQHHTALDIKDVEARGHVQQGATLEGAGREEPVAVGIAPDGDAGGQGALQRCGQGGGFWFGIGGVVVRLLLLLLSNDDAWCDGGGGSLSGA